MIVSQHSAWMPASWVFDNLLELVAKELQGDDPELADDLLQGRTDVSVGFVDLGELDAKRFQAFQRAVDRAYDREAANGPQGYDSPEYYEGFLERLRDLRKLIAADPRSGEAQLSRDG